MADDQILEVDGQSTEGITRDKAVEMLQGRPGTVVKLTVMHKEGDKSETIAGRGAPSSTWTASWPTSRKPDDSLGLDARQGKEGRLHPDHQLHPEHDRGSQEGPRRPRRPGGQGAIIDLRDNPGGLLSSAVEVSDLFLEDGVIVKTKGRNAPRRFTRPRRPGRTTTSRSSSSSISTPPPPPRSSRPPCRITSGPSSSASGASARGPSRTSCPSTTATAVLKLTVATYWRPSGKNIHRFKAAKDTDEWGVSPDAGMEVKFSEEEYETWQDLRRERDLISSHNKAKAKPEGEKVATMADKQLGKALEVVKEKMGQGAQVRK